MESEDCTGKRDKVRGNRDLIYKALLDPEFRKELKANPAAAMGVKELSPEKKAEVRMVVATVESIRDHIRRMGDELLCANGGPCGIA